MNRAHEKKIADQVNSPLGDGFIPSMKSQDGSFWMVHWWVLVHLSPELGFSENY
jgi:hypothetical protein